jgi:ParB-like chromosome segregation protein Spo0J
MLESNLPLQRLSISSIHEHGFLSKIDENIVTGLMDSIAVDGLNNPIAIWYQDHGEGVIPILVAGRHRLAAAKNLGFTEIDCIVLHSELQAMRWQISEDIFRRNQSVLERSLSIAQWLALRRMPAQVEPHKTRSAGQQAGGQNELSRETGISRSEIQRSCRIAKLSRDAVAVAFEERLHTNQSLLEKVACLHSEEQISALRGHKSSLQKSAKNGKNSSHKMTDDRSNLQSAALQMHRPAVASRSEDWQAADEGEQKAIWLEDLIERYNRGRETWQKEFLDIALQTPLAAIVTVLTEDSSRDDNGPCIQE